MKHNYELSDGITSHVRICNFSEKEKTFIESMALNNIPLRDIYAVVKTNFLDRHFTYRDIDNYV